MKYTVYHSMAKIEIGGEIMESKKDTKFGEPNQCVISFEDVENKEIIGIVLPDTSLKDLLEAVLHLLDENDGSAKETFNDVIDMVIPEDWY